MFIVSNFRPFLSVPPCRDYKRPPQRRVVYTGSQTICEETESMENRLSIVNGIELLV